MSGYVEPLVLSDEEHGWYTHLCGFTPRQGLGCDDCPDEEQVRCMREHTTESSLAAAMSGGLTRDEALRAYWEFIPTYIGIMRGAGVEGA